MAAIDGLGNEGWQALAARPLDTVVQPATARVLIVDDQLLFAEMLTLALELDGPFEVVGHAKNGREAIELAAWLRPDVVVMDIQMPVLDGIAATPLVLAAAPGTRVVVVSSSDAPEDPVRAREAGAAAFLGKNASSEDLVRSIERVAFQVVPLRPRASGSSPSADHMMTS
jgi:DNA-binding NarL/FixJ family response regulator